MDVVAIVGALRKSPKSLVVSPLRGSKSSLASIAGDGERGFILKLLKIINTRTYRICIIHLVLFSPEMKIKFVLVIRRGRR